MSETASTKPYLVRAIYEWCVDYGHTPYINVKVDAQTKVPTEFVKDGAITLNISTGATRNLKIDNERVHFSARFNGVSREISVPITAVSAIFARENGQGLVFDTSGAANGQPPSKPPPVTPPAPPAAGGRSHLKVVK